MILEFWANRNKQYYLRLGPIRLVECWDTDPEASDRGRLMGERNWRLTVHFADGSGSYSFWFMSKADREAIHSKLMAHAATTPRTRKS